jgi:hypothetical protein
MRSVTLFLLTLGACGVSETANRSTRCDVDTPCPGELFCYREFCIPGDGPREELDAGSITAEFPAGNPAAALIDAAGAIIDAADADRSDAQASDSADAQRDPRVTQFDDAGRSMGVGEPPTSSGDDGQPPTLVVDAGAAGHEAGRANRSALLICVPSCASRSFSCLICLRNVLDMNPGVCGEAQARSEPVVSGLCDYLCTNAACQRVP